MIPPPNYTPNWLEGGVPVPTGICRMALRKSAGAQAAFNLRPYRVVPQIFGRKILVFFTAVRPSLQINDDIFSCQTIELRNAPAPRSHTKPSGRFQKKREFNCPIPSRSAKPLAVVSGSADA